MFNLVRNKKRLSYNLITCHCALFEMHFLLSINNINPTTSENPSGDFNADSWSTGVRMLNRCRWSGCILVCDTFAFCIDPVYCWSCWISLLNCPHEAC